MSDLGDKCVAVIGAGLSGRAAVRLLLGQGARVTLLDRSLPQRDPAWPVDRIRLAVDGDPGVLDGVDLVVPSPGVPADHPLLTGAVERGVPLWSEIELASRFLDCPIVAITGTNGKSTTTVLVGNIVKAAGRRTFVGGNLGTPLSEAVTGDAEPEIAVVEVSSFQLEWIDRFRPRVAAWLNLTPDHLDRYADFTQYEAAKAAMLAQQGSGDVAVLNRDDPRVWAYRDRVRGSLLSFGRGPVDCGVMLNGTGALIRGAESRSISLRDSRLHGEHNRENICAAVAIAAALELSTDAIEAGLRATTGLPHRLELVAEKNGARFFDDSKATNVGAVEKSIASFDDGVILLLGGYDKGSDFAALRDAVVRRVEKLICFGAAGPQIATQLRDATSCELVSDVSEAVAAAAAAARPGQVVVLSPGCASFDEFSNYAERGRHFRALVEAL